MKLKEQVILASGKGQKKNYVVPRSRRKRRELRKPHSYPSLCLTDIFTISPYRCKVKLVGDNNHEEEKFKNKEMMRINNISKGDKRKR